MGVEILIGDVRERLSGLPDESIHCVVTSPPYWGLRDYGVERQLGLEPTPDLYIEHMLAVFREVRRVLRKDGTLWLNMGDCYAGSGCGSRDEERWPKQSRNDHRAEHHHRHPPGLKPKDLVGMPWRLALALQADGWYLRSDIVWSKPNPMPESCRDRPTKAHEYVFLMTKAPKYFFDQEAVREAAECAGAGTRGGYKAKQDPTGYAVEDYLASENHTYRSRRNIRSVWTIPTQPFPEAHFATFPEALVIPCIKAGTSEKGCCPKCGAPWVRVVERQYRGGLCDGDPMVSGMTRNKMGGQKEWDRAILPKTTGWRRSCRHKGEPIPCTVLDPFIGSGTTALVAARMGRSCIGIELSEEYAGMARRRLEAEVPLLIE